MIKAQSGHLGPFDKHIFISWTSFQHWLQIRMPGELLLKNTDTQGPTTDHLNQNFGVWNSRISTITRSLSDSNVQPGLETPGPSSLAFLRNVIWNQLLLRIDWKPLPTDLEMPYEEEKLGASLEKQEKKSLSGN